MSGAVDDSRRAASDEALLTAAREGDDGAYAVLYERHVKVARHAARCLVRHRSDADDLVSEAFARVLAAMRRGGGPQVAFRPYLLMALRNVHRDHVRRGQRDVHPDDLESFAWSEPAYARIDADEDRLVLEAYQRLPERWQAVLWYADVEGMAATDIGRLLGLRPNAVAQLTRRARQGLRDAYLAVHVRTPERAACRAIVAQLPAFARERLAARDAATVEAHLAECGDCQAAYAAMRDAGRPLRSVLVPAVLGVPAARFAAKVGRGITLVSPVVHASQAVTGVAAVSTVMAVGVLGGWAPISSSPATGANSKPAATAVAEPEGASAGNGSGGASGASGTRSTNGHDNGGQPPGGGAPGGGTPPAPGATAPVPAPVGGLPPGNPAVASPTEGNAPSAGSDHGQPSGPDDGNGPGSSANGGSPAVTVALPAVTDPGVAVGPVSVPGVTLPAVATPAISTPEVSTPEVSTPPISTPVVTIPSVTVPSVTVPPITLPPVTVPAVTVPVVTVPAVTVPPVTIPPAPTPALTTPPITVPAMTVPAVTPPKIGGALVAAGSASASAANLRAVSVASASIPAVSPPTPAIAPVSLGGAGQIMIGPTQVAPATAPTGDGPGAAPTALAPPSPEPLAAVTAGVNRTGAGAGLPKLLG